MSLELKIDPAQSGEDIRRLLRSSLIRRGAELARIEIDIIKQPLKVLLTLWCPSLVCSMLIENVLEVFEDKAFFVFKAPGSFLTRLVNNSLGFKK